MPILTLQKANGLKLRDAFPLINAGIFDFMGASPVWGAICDTVVMNNTLFFSFGNRIAAPVLSYFMCNDKTPTLVENTLHTIDDTDANAIAQMILARYGEKWKRMLAINDADYNPLNNYDMTEKEIISASGTKQDAVSINRANGRAETTTDKVTTGYSDAKTRTGTYAGTDTNAITGTTENAETQTADADAAIYAFNSTGAVPSNESDAKTVTTSSSANKQDNTTTSENKTAISETVLGERSETNKRAESESVIGSETQSRTGAKTDATTRALTRSGNIGVTTSVQMLEQEREFWVWSYIRVIIEDVADFLTIGVY